MSKIKLIPIALVFALLSGCSSDSKIDQVSSDVQSLNTKVDQLNSDVSVVRSDMQSVKDDASRANQRIDNQVHEYKK